ncbi:soluble calcium-activated nucleotidase [Achlya hypogyna]|uniref:Soluble calcium-activated nucleotidase n=1 Tax=Achlya hypogyna TaxID=1202772 RepID=A0A1V9ZUS2_ACHHY|nr:soluble calcium-activated nucleotidase [Achlya hypogyna]
MGLCNSQPEAHPRAKADGRATFALGLITDLDTASREVGPDGAVDWKAYFQKALLVRDAQGRFSVEWKEAVKVTTTLNEDGRGFELSELAWFQNRLLAVDDRTGTVFALDNFALDAAGPLTTTPLFAIRAGDGNEAKGQKNEWATVKDGHLHVGSHGTEYAPGGVVEHEWHKWVAVVPALDGASIEHVDWASRFQTVRLALGCPAPGYVTHEAIEWSAVHSKWFLLPRRVSTEPFDEAADATKGSNKLVLASPDFASVEVRSLGALVPERGFASFKFVPGSNDTLIAALKSVEVGDTQASFLCVFDVATGCVLLPDTPVPGAFKFEGLAFLQP